MPTSTYDPAADLPWDVGLDWDSLPPDTDDPAYVEIDWDYHPDFSDAPSGALVDPALAACAQITAGLDTLAALPAELVNHEAVLGVVDALMAGSSRAAGLLARYVHEVDLRAIYPPTAAGNPTATYLRHRFRLRPGPAKRIADRAEQMSRTMPELGAAMITGAADTAQADVIIDGMRLLPRTATPEQRQAALTELVDRCSSDDPLALAHAATAIAEELTLISEDGEPPDDEQEQQDRRYLRLRRTDGGIEGRFWAPAEMGAAIAAFIEAHSAPDDTDLAGRDTRTGVQRRLDALADACGHAATCDQHPGPPVPTVIITVDFDALTRALSGATLLDTDQPLPASVARRLCCEAGLLPAVLGADSVPLDLGRTRRLFGRAQRTALALRDRGCSFVGCTEPPARCQAHHLTEWADGGPTDLANGALLCARHHRQFHRQGWTGRIATNGRPEYIPPGWIDPAQQPQQHIRYQLNRIVRC